MFSISGDACFIRLGVPTALQSASASKQVVEICLTGHLHGGPSSYNKVRLDSPSTKERCSSVSEEM